jgi:hypothetical protein
VVGGWVLVASLGWRNTKGDISWDFTAFWSLGAEWHSSTRLESEVLAVGWIDFGQINGRK